MARAGRGRAAVVLWAGLRREPEAHGDDGRRLRAAADRAGLRQRRAQTTTVVSTTLTAPGAGYFDKGVFTFTSGPNAGLRRTVKSYVGGVFSFALPVPVPPGPGDEFEVYPVCGKRRDRCVEFGNEANFRGFRFVPKPEVAA